jgi:hypothetical protein
MNVNEAQVQLGLTADIALAKPVWKRIVSFPLLDLTFKKKRFTFYVSLPAGKALTLDNHR